MHIERMHKMQECLTEKAVNEFEKGIENVDTSEMGEVVDISVRKILQKLVENLQRTRTAL